METLIEKIEDKVLGRKRCVLTTYFKDKNFIMGLASGVIVMLLIGLILFIIQASGNLSKERAQNKLTNYLNELIGDEPELSFSEINSANESSDLYKLKFTVNGQQAGGYMTKNGKLFFPQAFEIASSSDTKLAPKKMTKSDKPKVEAFVMSYCPYGTQIEKGLLPVQKALGDKIDFSIKFVNYAMHGQKEMTENTRQYCIDKEQKDKFYSYLSCFLKSDKAEACLASTGINTTTLNNCMAQTDKDFKVTELFNNKDNWKGQFPPYNVNDTDNVKYGVKGSPTLVINGVEAKRVNRDSASLLNTICSAFNNAPEVCKTAKLSSAAPTPGFGEGTETNTNSGTADCATN